MVYRPPDKEFRYLRTVLVVPPLWSPSNGDSFIARLMVAHEIGLYLHSVTECLTYSL